MRSGIDRVTGEVLTGWAHCAQSIGVIATTRAGSLVMARDLGFDGDLQDAPQNQVVVSRYIAAVAEALRVDEPGFRLTRMRPTRAGADGVIAFDVAGDFYPNALDGDFTAVERGVSARVLTPFAVSTVTA